MLLADHGRYLGAHGMDAHNFGAFEEIYNIPLVVAGPGIARGVVTSARVGIHEICPTLCDFLGVSPIHTTDARSFAVVLSDPPANEHRFDSGYAEYHGTRFPLCQRVYWEGPWKFVFNGFDFDELYNLEDDPWETRNLAADKDQADRVRYMMARIWERIRLTEDNSLLNTHYYSMRFAAIGPNAALPPAP